MKGGKNMETQKIPFYKKKVFAIPMIALMLVAIVSAAVIFAVPHVDIEVSEGLVTTDLLVSPAGPVYAGEEVSVVINIENKASVDLPITLSWLEASSTPDDIANPIVESYTGPTSLTLTANAVTPVTLTWQISTGSGTGNFDGDITLTRV